MRSHAMQWFFRENKIPGEVSLKHTKRLINKACRKKEWQRHFPKFMRQADTIHPDDDKIAYKGKTVTREGLKAIDQATKEILQWYENATSDERCDPDLWKDGIYELCVEHNIERFRTLKPVMSDNREIPITSEWVRSQIAKQGFDMDDFTNRLMNAYDVVQGAHPHVEETEKEKVIQLSNRKIYSYSHRERDTESICSNNPGRMAKYEEDLRYVNAAVDLATKSIEMAFNKGLDVANFLNKKGKFTVRVQEIRIQTIAAGIQWHRDAYSDNAGTGDEFYGNAVFLLSDPSDFRGGEHKYLDQNFNIRIPQLNKWDGVALAGDVWHKVMPTVGGNRVVMVVVYSQE